MTSEVLVHIFAAIQGLEKCITGTKKALSGSNKARPDVEQALGQQEQIVGEMRKHANKLQLQIAGNDYSSIIRSLDVIYGLNSMVRSEVISTYSAITYGITRREAAPEIKLSYH